MLLTIKLNVFLNVLKIIGAIDDSFDYNLQISVTEDYVSISMLYYDFDSKIFTIYTKINIQKDNFDIINVSNNNNNETILLKKEHVQKICLLGKWYPRLSINIEMNYDVVNIFLLDSIQNQTEIPVYKIITESNSNEIVNEPILLKNTCVIETENFKRALEMCLYTNQCIVIILSKTNIIIQNENMDTNITVVCELLKKVYIDKFKLKYNNAKFILSKLNLIKSKECLIYIEKGLPFVIEDTDNGFRLFSDYQI